MNIRRIAAARCDPREYIDGANRAFGQWGDEAMFRWAFRDDAEIILIDDHRGAAVAGSGINRRNLRAGGRAFIISGSWVLPEARGRGLFARLVAESREIAREHGALTLGFVRAENPSARGLASAGFNMHPSFYCRSIFAETKPVPTFDVCAGIDASSFRSTFAYTAEQWRVQFLERPGALIECVGIDRWQALIERTREFDRVLAISDDAALPLLASAAHASGRRLFWYTTRPPSLECDCTPGFLGVSPSSSIAWDLQNGDRI